MDPNTQQIITATIQNILSSVWTGVANSIIEKKIALQASHLETFQFIASYISNNLQNRQARTEMMGEKDPKNIEIDNIAYGQLPKQVIKDNKTNTSRKVSIAESVNQTRSRRFTIQTFYSKKSPDKQSNAPSDNNTNNNNALITLPQSQDRHYVKDQQQDKFRTLKFRSQRQDQEMKNMVKDRQKLREESNNKNKKILKDMKKYTFDYEGNFFGTSGFQATHQKMIKLDKNQSPQIVTNRQSKNPQQKNIINQKIKQRQTRNNKQFAKGDKNAPEFVEDRPQSLLDFFQQQSKISEGIKLTGQKGKEKIVKQRPQRKLSGMKKYRLNEYQGIIKDKKFKDFKRQIYKYSTPNLQPNKTAPLPLNNDTIDQNQYSPSKNNQIASQASLVLGSKKSEDISSKLPPILSTYTKGDRKLALKKLSRAFPGYYNIQSSRTILDQSSVLTRKSHKSQIKIDSQQLYSQIFPTGNHYH